jgi:hypothetical protein
MSLAAAVGEVAVAARVYLLLGWLLVLLLLREKSLPFH